jgi:23S rRNA pseudouridine1911/1915/1917 synthase
MLSVSSAHGSLAKSGKREQTLYALLNAYVKVNKRMQRKEDLISGVTPDRSIAKVWIVHRLDKGTSGAVVFAKDERAKDLLQSKWKELVAERRYVAWLEGKVEKDAGAIQSWLLESPKSLKMKSFDTEVKDGQLAITHYKVLQRTKYYSEVEFELETGRKNQIRVHAAELGHPVAGDDKYGAQTNPIKRLALHAHTLVFRNPYSQKMVRCTSPLPDSFGRFVK